MRIQALFHHLPTACFAFDRRGRIHAWNEACKGLFQLSRDDVLGKPAARLFSTAESSAMSFTEFIRRVLAGARLERVPLYAKRSQVGPIRFLCYAFPIERADGAIDGAVCVCMDGADKAATFHGGPREHHQSASSSSIQPSDVAVVNLILQEEIRERKQAEENVRQLVAGARCLFWNAIVLDDKGSRLIWFTNMPDEEASQSFLPLDLETHRHYADAFYLSRLEADRLACDQRAEDAIRNGRGYSQEFRCRRRDGEVRWLTEDVSIETLAPGRWRATGVCVDVTERKALQTQLSDDQRIESIGHLAAGIAHEINTPIQYVGDNIRFLKESFGDLVKLIEIYQRLLLTARGQEEPDLQERIRAAAQDADLDYLLGEIPCSIEQSLEGIERVAAIVKAMKEFSDPGSSEKTPVDINHALESTIIVARNEWKYVANILTRFDPDLPVVRCLPGDLNQVFLNLIINSAQAIREKIGDSPDEKGIIRVETTRGQDWIEVRVEDNGKGIPETVRSKVFDPFFTTRDVGQGVGQGLSISRMVVVDKHQGTISFETEENVGTTFIIRLPIAPALEPPIRKAA